METSVRILSLLITLEIATSEIYNNNKNKTQHSYIYLLKRSIIHYPEKASRNY